ncbi:MAG: hypothetical protein LBM16_05585, partial [Clostridiales bacterium]|nr:hypothetical protein [Clostridiales bacterium]
MDNTADRIIEKIKNAGKVFIAGHINPDGDCVGACAALFHIVKKLNSVPVALLEPFHNKFDFAGLE